MRVIPTLGGGAHTCTGTIWLKNYWKDYRFFLSNQGATPTNEAIHPCYGIVALFVTSTLLLFYKADRKLFRAKKIYVARSILVCKRQGGVSLAPLEAELAVASVVVTHMFRLREQLSEIRGTCSDYGTSQGRQTGSKGMKRRLIEAC